MDFPENSPPDSQTSDLIVKCVNVNEPFTADSSQIS